ncbi:MAG: threonine/serine exporter family protein [Candidatus Cellulosilyticum pullistercoris]|uniref:Threonine/serine exporter family protein n=1 Tax=Candidatus Cellulosilyticum pullistercoris TaxID=2838521 RepID=A0A9E2KE25_9FIRM|nr:threonine/serine exporter family protein [Candidatus Cellulosilyticum pullistercoris]
MILSILSAFISTIGFSIVFHVQKKHLLICGMVGAISWTIYLLLNDQGNSSVFASFLATLVVTTLSYLLAKKRKTPITVFLIAGIIPLVPGLGLYRMMSALLDENYSLALDYATLTFEIAGVIAGAIVIVSLLPLLWRKPRKK